MNNDLIMRYAMRLGIGILVFILASIYYWSWRNDLINRGRELERAEWVDREREKQIERDIILKKNQEDYLNAIKIYVKHGEDAVNKLRNIPPRVRVITKQAVCNGDSISTAGISGTSKQLDAFAELDERVTINLNQWAARNDLGRQDCQQIIDFVTVNGMVK